ncbi:CBS domain-containing protein [Lampropedia aestuarii]|uniref:CBS domain-containing protein n=1 Tax=Lampropedia aestuarii TaxID=2562762 RepID=A0A4S5BQN0_9BURK|nr:transporter associated domain-containing protein [Lampropedia aestuarii]MDH5858421.1 transporter associated domain-containing protein [Lampropedia aestuarii]THJ31986.1 CBS domain-containing protein [Lampropedia aestuarii]
MTTEPTHSKPSDKDDKRSLRQRLTDFLHPPPATPEALIEIIAAAEDSDTIKPDVRIMLERVIRLEQLTASDAMVSTSRMDLLDIDAAYEDLLDKVIRDAHSRFPVYEGSRDNIIGVLLSKHLLQLQRSPNLNVRALLRPPLVLPETKRLSDLLREFRLHRNHMAILVDEFGRTSGLITIEDVLEEIVGEIEDEFDEPEDEGEIYQLANGSWRVRGDTPIEKVQESFEVRLTPDDFDDDIETIGGLVTQQLGRVPARGEVLELAGLRFEVLFAKGGAVRWFRVRRQTSE